MEKELYLSILDFFLPFISKLQISCQAISEYDVLLTFAERADNLNWHCPEFVPSEEQSSDKTGIQITKGRHPVVEQLPLKAQILSQGHENQFIANDCNLNEAQKMLLITGPNMGGKSTYMRQIALITLLAHIGSFVPADQACFSEIDRIFTRIGAQDDLASGRSTFMVEMTETANILNSATDKSLVLLDEIGRGTSTYDGLSLAYATAYHLAREIKSYTLFSTHYFELTQLASTYPNITNVFLDAEEYKNKLVFLHHVKLGSVSKSYGLHVAALAGVPEKVIKLAQNKLKSLELEQTQTNSNSQEEIKTFHKEKESTTDHLISQEVINELKTLDCDQLSAREALNIIYQVQEKLKSNN